MLSHCKYLFLTVLVSVFLIFTTVAPAQTKFEFSAKAISAYKLALELKLTESKALCDEIKQTDPENLIPLYIESYIDFFTILINEDYDEFKQLEKLKKERVKAIKGGDRNSPYYRMILGEINLFWSISRLKFDEKYRALLDANSAYRYLSENQDMFPDFLPTKKSLSIIHAMAESIPGIFKFLLAIEGSIQQGTKEIEELVEYGQNNEFIFQEEAVAIYTYILYSQNNKPEEAWQIMTNSTKLNELRSPLKSFLFAFMAQKTGRNEEAINYLKERPVGKEYHQFHYLDFMLGKSLLYKLDKDARKYILEFIEKSRGRHYLKEAYQKIAWYELAINKDNKAYLNNIAQCKEVGHKLVDGDKQALKEAKQSHPPHPILLTARLLFDGGYYHQAQIEIQTYKSTFSPGTIFELEYYYRRGRINHALKKYQKAIESYSTTLSNARGSRSYFVCNSALQLALIYEDQDKPELAKKYFKLCLDLKPTEYKNSIHQKAKSGLDRLKTNQ